MTVSHYDLFLSPWSGFTIFSNDYAIKMTWTHSCNFLSFLIRCLQMIHLSYDLHFRGNKTDRDDHKMGHKYQSVQPEGGHQPLASWTIEWNERSHYCLQSLPLGHLLYWQWHYNYSGVHLAPNKLLTTWPSCESVPSSGLINIGLFWRSYRSSGFDTNINGFRLA